MKFTLYNDIKSFYGDTYNVLLHHEAQNLIPLGNIIIGYEGKDKTEWRDPAAWFMAAVSDKNGILLTAVMTPPFNVTLYATDNIISEEALSCLIQGIGETDFSVPGVMAEKSLAECFAKTYAALKGTSYSIRMSQRIYELTSVNPEIPLKGNLRLADERDMSFLPYWIENFYSDCFFENHTVKNETEHYLHLIKKEKFHVLECDNTPVSMAQINREMQTVCGVSAVYTPPYFRAKGYATSCVAKLSLLILERGFAKCVLYTDLANPTSNSIYQKIGYTPLCDSVEIRFAPQVESEKN